MRLAASSPASALASAAIRCAVLGELLALDVVAVDLEGGWIHVHRSWDRGAKKFIPTKSRKPRSVPIIDKLAALLSDHFVLLNRPSEGLLFPSTNNPAWPTDAGILRRRTHARWKKAGLKPLGFHEGRHTYASIGIAAGLNPKTLSTYLGHSTITITLDRYGHMMPGSEVERERCLTPTLTGRTSLSNWVKCIFCQREGKASREHLWPRWTQGTFDAEERKRPVRHSIEPHDGPREAWDAPPFSATLKDVCQHCNNGWMSQIEAEAKVYMEPLIRGDKGQLIDVEAQWAISRWAYLKVLLFERVDKRHRLHPNRRYREMYESSLGEPTLPANMSVFLAAHEGLRHGQYAHRLLADAETRMPELFMGTVTIRHLIVQVIENIAEDGEAKTFQHDKRIAGHEARIWPFTKPFKWPPGIALTDAGLEIFGGPKPGQKPSHHSGSLR
jgi:hypothetical protein